MTPEERRQAIIEAVQPLLLTQGPALSTRQIAAAAGVAEGTLFRVFESKQELIGAAALAALRAELAVAQLSELPPGSPLEVRLADVLLILQSEIGRTRALSMALHPLGQPITHLRLTRHSVSENRDQVQVSFGFPKDLLASDSIGIRHGEPRFRVRAWPAVPAGHTSPATVILVATGQTPNRG